MAIAGGEHRTRHIDRQIELGTHVEVAGVDVATTFGWGQHHQLTRLVGRHAHRAAEGLERYMEVITKSSAYHVGQVKMADIGRGEILCQQAEAWNESGPAPFEWLKLQDFDFEDVARLRAINPNRPGQRIKLVE